GVLRQKRAGLGLKNGNERFVLGSLLRRELALVALSCEFLDAGLRLGVCPNLDNPTRHGRSEAATHVVEEFRGEVAITAMLFRRVAGFNVRFYIRVVPSAVGHLQSIRHGTVGFSRHCGGVQRGSSGKLPPHDSEYRWPLL